MGASAVLRASTAEDHERVDASVSGYLDRGLAGCRGFLRVAQRIVVPWESELWRFVWPAELQARIRLGKSSWLEEDLGELRTPGVTAHAATAGEAWGALYVFEGSTMGSMVMAKRFERGTFRYLDGYGAQTHAMWSSMKAMLDGELTEEAALAEAVRGARRVFAQFAEELSGT
jgi:heme oxygenase